MIFICYPKCTTCMKAKKWLDAHGLLYSIRNIKEDTPSTAELKQWHEKSGLPLRKFFNTCGMLYRNLNLKEKLLSMSEDEMYTLLASDGMLIKRPLLITEQSIFIGFKEKDWSVLL